VEKERLARGSRSKEQKFIDHDRQVARMRAWIRDFVSLSNFFSPLREQIIANYR